MESIEEIKTKYMLFEEEIKPDTMFDCEALLDSLVDDMDDALVGIRRSIRENNLDKAKALVLRPIAVILGYDEVLVDCYDEDNEVLGMDREMTLKYRELFNRMKSAITRDNFRDVGRLAQYTYDNYMDNYEYFESIRDSIEMRYVNGFTLVVSKKDTQEEFLEFFEEEFKNVTNLGFSKVKEDK